MTEHSDALDLEQDIFKARDPDRIARSLKHSAEASHRRKGNPYRSAMSMLSFYINRAGKILSEPWRRTLEHAKTSLRRLFDREAAHQAATHNSSDRGSLSRLSADHLRRQGMSGIARCKVAVLATDGVEQVELTELVKA